MRMTTKQAARGKWDGILVELLGEAAVSRKHTSCPICGGQDRYRYDNNRNDGDWFCNHCGTGDGFKLLMGALGVEFAEAALRVDRIVGNIEEQPFKADINIDQRRRKLNDLWSASQQPFVAYDYLVGRGVPSMVVDDVGKDVRGIERLDLYDGKACVGQHPAMVALIRNPKGEPVSIHRTYLTPDGKQKKIMPSIENIVGGAVRLGEPDQTLVLAEGIETALAGWAISGYPAWATISAHGLEEFKSPPKHVKRIIVCADNDYSFVGQAAAFKCASYLRNRHRIAAEVWMPTLDGMDMLDMLNDERTHPLQMLKWRGS